MSMSASAQADEEGRKVFLGGLSFDTREDDLRADFAKFGDLEDVQLPMGDMGRHKGFAFLTYAKAEEAQEACREHHQKDYMGREISAKVVVPREQRGGGGGGRGLPPLSQEMSEKLEQWVTAKRQRDFETSDRLRAEMKDAGFNPEEYRPKPGYGGGGYDGGGGRGLPPLSRDMEDKLEQWVAAKRQRDFETADRLRAEMKDAGVNPEEYRPKPGGGGGGFGGGGYGGGGYGGGDRYDDRRRDDRYDDRRDRYDDRRDRYDDRRDRYDDRRRDRSYSPDRRRGYDDRRRDDRNRDRSYSPDRRRGHDDRRRDDRY